MCHKIIHHLILRVGWLPKGRVVNVLLMAHDYKKLPLDPMLWLRHYINTFLMIFNIFFLINLISLSGSLWEMDNFKHLTKNLLTLLCEDHGVYIKVVSIYHAKSMLGRKCICLEPYFFLPYLNFHRTCTRTAMSVYYISLENFTEREIVTIQDKARSNYIYVIIPKELLNLEIL